MTIDKDSLYTVSFAGRSDANRTITVSVMKNSSPWTTFFSSSFLLTAGWKKFELSFRAPETCTKDTRLSFHLGSEAGTYWFDEIHFVSSAIKGLADDESLESHTVRRIVFSECGAYSDPRVMDMSAFYLQIQNDFFADMMSYLKNELGVKVPIVGTNWNVGPADLAVQSQLDYLDNHSYWDHPQFPGKPWDSYNWLIENTPMVRSASGGTIPALMGGVGFQGKPFTISEYNHAFPNRYQSEGVLFLAAYASFHDVDGIMFFDYCGSSDDWETDKVDGYFSIHRNTAMMALMPSCASAYRSGYIASAQQTIFLNYSQDQIQLLPKNDTRNWQRPETFPRTLALQHAVRNASFDSDIPLDPSSLPPEPTSPYVSDTGEISWDANGLMKVATPFFAGATGFLNQFSNHQIGDLILVTASGFGTMSWITATGESLQLSERSLITLSSKLQNSGMVWDGTRTVHNNWGNPPTQMEPIYVKLRLKIQADSIRVYPLDVTGAAGVSFYEYLPLSENLFEISLNQNQDRTVWFGIEGFSGRAAIKPEEPPARFRLGQNYPNPFDNSGKSGSQTKIKYELPGKGKIRLTIYDLLGRTVRVLVDEDQVAGNYELDWDGRDANGKPIEAGIYFYRMEGNLSGQKLDVTKKMMVLK